ncbi:hypothetical protein IPH25_02795 [bacterium]|nr:MAG: hypothetical protein IPG37_04935 [bacterium]QQR61395.1 MAG: hypothetical protein IPH25_02795 [bacterium]QQR63084.1 MAG: hypothetical protein IPH67_01245 [bacterium]
MESFLKIFTGKTYRFAATFLISGMIYTAIVKGIGFTATQDQNTVIVPYYFQKDGSKEQKINIGIPIEEKSWKIVEQKEWPTGDKLKPMTLESVYRGDHRPYDFCGPEGTAYIEEGLKRYQALDEQTINQQIKKLARLFVKDVGQLCNDNVLNSFEGLESLKRLWLNRYDHELAAEQQKRFYKIQAKIKQHEFPENPAFIIRSLPWKGLSDGEYDERFNQEVQQELKLKNIKPYTPEELEQKKTTLTNLYQNTVNYRYDKEECNPIRVFTSQFDPKKEISPIHISFLATLNRVFDIFLDKGRNLTATQEDPSICFIIRTSDRERYTYFLPHEENSTQNSKQVDLTQSQGTLQNEITVKDDKNNTTPEEKPIVQEKTSFWSKLRPYNHIVRYAAVGSFCCAGVGFVGYKIHQWWKDKKAAKKKPETKK